MKIIIYFLLIFLNYTFYSLANDKNISFITVTGASLRSVTTQTHNAAYMNGMKIVGSRTVKVGDNWVRTVKIKSRH